MVGFDLPHVAHDMILRFIGVDFSVINSHKASTGAIPSSVGDDVKPVDGVANPGSSSGAGGDSTSGGGNAPPKGTTPGDPAMWQGMIVRKYFTHHTLSVYCLAYYNAGSAALVLVVIAVVIGGGIYIRSRRRGKVRLASDREQDEESIPLNQSVGGTGDGERGDYVPIGEGNGATTQKARTKGKQKAIEEPAGAAIFDVGEDEDEAPGSHGH